jgi:hypothetical protein
MGRPTCLREGEGAGRPAPGPRSGDRAQPRLLPSEEPSSRYEDEAEGPRPDQTRGALRWTVVLAVAYSFRVAFAGTPDGLIPLVQTRVVALTFAVESGEGL